MKVRLLAVLAVAVLAAACNPVVSALPEPDPEPVPVDVEFHLECFDPFLLGCADAFITDASGRQEFLAFGDYTGFCVVGCDHTLTFDTGTVVTVTVQTDVMFEVRDWRGECDHVAVGDVTCTFTVDEDSFVYAAVDYPMEP